ncbi:MAG: hypothetical protein AAGA92_04040 [Planctomycetota bacterium]
MNADHEDTPRRLRLRFSLKLLLLVMTAAAGFFYWWAMPGKSPQDIAEEFAEHFNRGEFQAAADLFAEPKDGSQARWSAYQGACTGLLALGALGEPLVSKVVGTRGLEQSHTWVVIVTPKNSSPGSSIRLRVTRSGVSTEDMWRTDMLIENERATKGGE